MYKLNTSNIVRLADNASIPLDPDNTDYAEYLIWLSEGNTPEPADIPVKTIPSEVTARQARLALHQIGQLSQIDTIIASFPAELQVTAKIEWDYSSVISRKSSLVAMLGQTLGLTDQDLDNLFITASLL